MSSSRFVVAGLLVAFAALAGCSTESGGKEKEDVGTYDSELRLSGTRYLGKIINGETKSGYYDSPPNYRSYAFDAKGGDEITVDIKSAYGDAMGWITDASYNVLAANDDASSATLDAKVKYRVPTNQESRSYRIIFRDYDMLEATFTVKLSISNTSAPKCTYGGQGYQPGDRFEALDGCNTCTCSASGAISCSKLACMCNPASEPHRSYVGTPQQCTVIRYTCQAGQVPFSNSCGCGCETLQ